jgi:DNA-binding MarR family transcriptional regulator
VDETIDQPISFETRRTAGRLRKALKVLSSMNNRMSLPQALTFLHAAADEGLTVTRLAERCGVAPTTISKHLRDLGEFDRLGEPSLGLLTIMQRSFGDRREHHVILTKRGTAVARTMIAALRGRSDTDSKGTPPEGR